MKKQGDIISLLQKISSRYSELKAGIDLSLSKESQNSEVFQFFLFKTVTGNGFRIGLLKQLINHTLFKDPSQKIILNFDSLKELEKIFDLLTTESMNSYFFELYISTPQIKKESKTITITFD